MKNRSFSVVLLALIAAATYGCSSEGGDQGPAETTGTSALALSATTGGMNPVTYTVAGVLTITPVGAGCTPTHTITTAAGDAVIQDVLLPCSYNVTMPTPVCTASDSSAAKVLVGCGMVPLAQPFTVTAGVTTALTLQFTFNYNTQEASTVVFGVGGADITLGGTPNVSVLCGTRPQCTGGALCYQLNGAAATPQCYMPCDFVEGDANGGLGTMASPMAECTAGTCGPVLPTSGMPNTDLDAIPGVCSVPVPPPVVGP